MNTTLTKTMKSVITLMCIFSITFFATTNSASSQTMTMAPHKIILNALGNSVSVQAVVPMHLTVFDGCEATLTIGDYTIAETSEAKYCYIDDNLLVYFDKIEVLTHPDMLLMDGTVQTATVEGNVFTVDADGNSITLAFTAFDDVEIVDPDKKQK
ncbi:MAG: hypothetical protein V3T31_01645 [candidate division Zixibacteria bacterium]